MSREQFFAITEASGLAQRIEDDLEEGERRVYCLVKSMSGLANRSRRPYRHANRLPFQIEKLIVQLRKEHTSLGVTSDL